MVEYALTDGAMPINAQPILRSDGAIIPPDPANRDWQAYQEWLAEGNLPVPSVAPAPDTAAEARAALEASDRTVIRCVEAGVAVPAEWVAYRRALRAVVAGTSATMPGRPAYSAGT
ncbi:MAG: hypothetical protein P4L98_05450 [Ancalomicrobiaceae bacterium]|nr:hypothetical protein [Ancalomicrobiaceae bacterium]